MVGLDVAEKVVLTLEDIDATQFRDQAVKKFLYETAHICIHKQLPGAASPHRLGFVMYDPLAVGVAIDRSLVETEHWYVDVETRGEITTGKTLADVRGRTGKQPNTQVCVEVDAKGFNDLFLKTVAR